MPALLIRHQRIDFDQWHQAFLKHLEVRLAHGALTEVILRDALNPDDVWVLIQWDDLYRAQLFARSEDLQDQLDQSGIAVPPEIWFVDVLTNAGEGEQPQPTEGGASLPEDEDLDRQQPPNS